MSLGPHNVEDALDATGLWALPETMKHVRREAPVVCAEVCDYQKLFVLLCLRGPYRLKGTRTGEGGVCELVPCGVTAPSLQRLLHPQGRAVARVR